MFIEKRKFKNSKGSTLSAIYEGENRNAKVVVLCHGYESSKDKETNRLLAEKLVERDISVLRFDFTGHGQSEGNMADITPLQELDDLNCAVKNLGKEDPGLYGSSFGGYIALLYASDNSISALALKAPVSDYTDKESSFVAARSSQFFEDVKSINLYKKVKNISCPCLIIHGDRDDVVPLRQSKKLYQSLVCDKRLQVIHGADHDMKGEYLEKTYNLIADFFKRNLLTH